MLPFSIELRPGLPLAEQIVYAVKKAVVTGQLRPGDAFPSVRQLSQDLRINPNTAQKVAAALVQEGVLITTPAVGSFVARPEEGNRRARAALLGAELEHLVVEAKRLGLTLDEVADGLAAHWEKLSPSPKHERHRNPRPDPAVRPA
jgi:GntR family transcriptional regulator